MFCWQAIGSVLWAMALPRFKNEKAAYALSLVIGAVGFASCRSYTTRTCSLCRSCSSAAHGLPCSPCRSPSSRTLLRATATSAYLGLFNGTICIPQIIAAACGGTLLSMVGSVQSNMMLMAAASLVLGALCVARIKK